MALHTPLYDKHVELKAKMIDFFGYQMPVQYTSIVEEHLCVRESVGVFDLSHMGEILVLGQDATKFLNRVTTNDVAILKLGGIQYSFITNDQGGIVDDILIYRVPDGYYLVVNASNTEKDYQWLLTNMNDDQVEVRNVTSETTLLAIQGPNSLAVVEATLNQPLSDLKYYSFVDLDYQGCQVRVSRTGYTGEDGFELYFATHLSEELWDRVLDKGEMYNILPIGLGARDTLRLEMRMPLYGQELTEEITPLEAGLRKFVSFDKGDFIGRQALEVQKQAGVSQRLIGFELLSKGIARTGYEVYKGDQKIGFVTSGTKSPSTGKSIGLGYLDKEYAKAGNEIMIKIRKQLAKAEIKKGRFKKVK